MAKLLASLSQFAAMPGVPSEPTLRKLIEENPDFPVVNRGKNGQAYEIDAEAGIKWLADRRAKEEEERRSHQENLNQLALGFLGSDAASAQAADGLSPKQLAETMEVEVAAIRLGALRGEFVRKAEVEQSLGEFAVWIRQTFRGVSAKLAKRVDVPREVLVALDALIDTELHQLADRAERLGAAVPAEE